MKIKLNLRPSIWLHVIAMRYHISDQRQNEIQIEFLQFLVERRGSSVGLVCIAPEQWRCHRVVQVGWSWLQLNHLRLDLICCYMEQQKYKTYEDLN